MSSCPGESPVDIGEPRVHADPLGQGGRNRRYGSNKSFICLPPPTGAVAGSAVGSMASRRRDEHRDTTQDPGGGRRLRRSGVRSPAGAQARRRRGRRHPGDTVRLPALSAAAAPGRLRRADAPVDRAVPAPQQQVPHPDHPGRRHRRGPRRQGVRHPHDHRRDRQRAVRLHRAGPRQHHPHLRHPGSDGPRVRHEDPRRGRVHP